MSPPPGVREVRWSQRGVRWVWPGADFDALLLALDRRTDVESLVLCGGVLDVDACVRLARTLKFRDLEFIIASGCRIGDGGAAALERELPLHPTLKFRAAFTSSLKRLCVEDASVTRVGWDALDEMAQRLNGPCGFIDGGGRLRFWNDGGSRFHETMRARLSVSALVGVCPSHPAPVATMVRRDGDHAVAARVYLFLA